MIMGFIRIILFLVLFYYLYTDHYEVFAALSFWAIT